MTLRASFCRRYVSSLEQRGEFRKAMESGPEASLISFRREAMKSNVSCHVASSS
jgi:hypothetical protein